MSTLRAAITLPIALVIGSIAFAQTDDKKTATALLQEARRHEAEGAFEKAIAKAQKAAEKAGENKMLLAEALQVMGRSHECMAPENIEAAQKAYEKLLSEAADGDKTIMAWAQEKVSWKGVDVWIAQYHTVLKNYRDKERHLQLQRADLRGLPESDPRVQEHQKALADLKTALSTAETDCWAKIEKLDKEATAGLIHALGGTDEVVRATAARFLAEVIDEAGIATLVSKLSDDGLRPGAGLALGRIFDEFAEGRKYDALADKMEEDLKDIKPPSDKSEAIVKNTLEAVKKLRENAAAVRHNIPKELNASSIQEALKNVLSNEKHRAAQIEAAKALESIGQLSGELVDALGAQIDSKDRNVRLAACFAAGAVDTTRNEDKRKLADKLIDVVTRLPERENTASTDFANDPAVRAAAATSLGRIGVIKAIPALIRALEDNSADVRTRAHAALLAIVGKEITFEHDGRTCTYESEPHVQDPGLTAADPATRKREAEAAKRAKQVELRKKGVEAWDQWWKETAGIVTLIERFYRFASSWKAGDPTALYQKEEYLQETRVRAYVFSNPAEALVRAERNAGRFQQQKDFLQQDALDLGSAAIPKLIQFIGGELPDLEKGLTKELTARNRAATRLFIAETIAKLSAQGGSDAIATLRESLSSGSSPNVRAGAALALGFLPRDQITAQDREVLGKRGLADAEGDALSGRPIVREAAARALKSVGSADNAAGLTTVAKDRAPENERAQIWALRALAAIKPKNADTVKALGELVGHEQEGSDLKSTNALVRELVCDALAEIAEPAAITDFYLLRARRDLARNVRDAAQRAVRAIGQAHPEVADTLTEILRDKDEKQKANDRIGAALALGDLGQKKFAVAMAYRVVDENPPLVLRDADPGVRAAVCRGLATMGEKARFRPVGEALVRAMDEEASSEQVRRDAYAALRAIGESELPPFDAAAKPEDRHAQLTEVRRWLESARWPDAPG